ncbi:MAG TPA: hypothetical protein VK871_10560 [Candidatus Limnocylindrales bacterium]|nr:hypothetical protein [Candidatus Limnocylindrales bacterium]
MPLPTNGAQRASGHRSLRLTVALVVAAFFASTGLAVTPAPVDAAGIKVVVVVGPAGSSTSNYIYNAKKLAAQARSYGATVYEVYSPYATWSKVKSVAQGANVLIYLGHGNGYPSPYGAFNRYTKDGMGLNTTAGSSRHTYYGEYYIDTQINLAPNAVVILNRLCYASGNSEWGAGYPSKSTAIQRVDNYGAGFLRANAKAVFAEGINSTSYILYGLFKTKRTMGEIFWSSPATDGRYDFVFRSLRTKPWHGVLDPIGGANRYYRSLVGDFMMTATTWRSTVGTATATR